jgi:hypothetical protein
MSSPWHQHFNGVVNGVAACKLCLPVGKVEVACPNGGTSGKTSHLFAAHRQEHDKIKINVLEKKCTQLAFAANQGKLGFSASPSKAHKAKTKRLMAQVCAGDLKPLSSFSLPHMKALLKHVSNGNDTSHDHKTMMTENNNLKLELETRLAVLVQGMDAFSIDTDGWSCASKGFICFNLTGVVRKDDKFRLVTRCFEVSHLPGRHTGEALAKAVDDAVDRLSARGGVPGVTRRKRVWAANAVGAATQQKALSMLGDGFSLWQIWCACHVMHLSVKDTFASNATVLKMLKKFKRLAVSIKNSNLLTSQLAVINENLGINVRKVGLDVVTRWTSRREHMGSMLVNKEALDQMGDEAAQMADEREARNQKNTLLDAGFDEKEIDDILGADELGGSLGLTPFDWLLCEHVERVLRPAAEVSGCLEGRDYGTMGLVLPMFVKLHKVLDEEREQMRVAQHALLVRNSDAGKAFSAAISFVQSFQEQLRKRFDPFDFSEKNRPYLVATFLLPGYSKFPFYAEQQDRVDARKAAIEFCVADMEDVRGMSTYTPEWARLEELYYAKKEKEDEEEAEQKKKKKEEEEKKKKEEEEQAANANVGDKREADGDAHDAIPPAKKKHKSSFMVDLLGDGEASESEDDQVGAGIKVRPSDLKMVETYADIRFKNVRGKEQDADVMLAALSDLVFGDDGDRDMTMLLRVALRYYSMPASSANSERVWSSGTLVMEKKRQSFTGENASVMIFNHCNRMDF